MGMHPGWQMSRRGRAQGRELPDQRGCALGTGSQFDEAIDRLVDQHREEMPYVIRSVQDGEQRIQILAGIGETLRLIVPGIGQGNLSGVQPRATSLPRLLLGGPSTPPRSPK